MSGPGSLYFTKIKKKTKETKGIESPSEGEIGKAERSLLLLQEQRNEGTHDFSLMVT